MKEKPEFAVRVECSAGHGGEPTPTSFSFGGTRIEVTEVVDVWLTSDHPRSWYAARNGRREERGSHFLSFLRQTVSASAAKARP